MNQKHIVIKEDRPFAENERSCIEIYQYHKAYKKNFMIGKKIIGSFPTEQKRENAS